MSASVRAQTDDRNIELGSAVNWRLIVAAAGLGLAVLIAVVVLGLAAPAAPKLEPVAAQKTVVPATDQNTFLPPQPEPRPQPAVVVAIAKPALSQRRKAYSKPAVVVSTPEPAKPTQVMETTPAQSFKRYSSYGEGNLRDRLYKDSRELDVETEKGTTAKLLAEAAKAVKPQSADKDADKPQAKTPPILELIAKRDDLKGLPVREVDKCQVPAKEAKIMSEMSVSVRTISAKLRETDSSFSTSQSYVVCLDKYLKQPEWREETGVRMMVQMLQVEDEDIRMKMIKLLADNKEKRTSAALAQRAVFDLNPDIRLAAIARSSETSRLPAEGSSRTRGVLLRLPMEALGVLPRTPCGRHWWLWTTTKRLPNW